MAKATADTAEVDFPIEADAIRWDEIPDIDSAKAVDEEVEVKFSPRLAGPDKVLLADKGIKFYITEITIQEGNNTFGRKSDEYDDEPPTFWALRASCLEDLHFGRLSPARGFDGRKVPLDIPAREEFQFSLPRHDAREAVMTTLLRANHGTGSDNQFHTIGPVRLVPQSYLSNGTPMLTIEKA